MHTERARGISKAPDICKAGPHRLRHDEHTTAADRAFATESEFAPVLPLWVFRVRRDCARPIAAIRVVSCDNGGVNRGSSRRSSERDTPPFAALVDVLVILTIVSALLIWLARLLSYTGVDLLVVGQAALPLSMLPVWFALAATAWRSQPIRGAVCGVLCAAWVLALLPAVGRDPRPSFADQPGTPRFRLFSANVYTDNQRPLTGTLRAANADVLVLTEFSRPIEAQLRRDGALNGYLGVADNGAEGTWRTAILSRLPLSNVRVVEVPGSPRTGTPVVTADIAVGTAVGTQTVRVIGAHPVPLTVDGADRAFRATTRVIRDEVRAAGSLPVIVAGDFNGTRWLPATGELFDLGLASVHEVRGFGLSASWPMGRGWVPRFMRLDHVLISKQLFPIGLVDVDVPGSDHAGSLVTFATNPQP
jgi:endonuclease/exonuclease/phosphatase (EEP) superfamily protein YafD